ncbi:MAG TPA: short chain dehydrogenase [Rhabdochlamydiaceae bacterium]|jgi:NAD(P)-dependent dehydrogenase (short-subunit alcohol dehydrogenase family)
MKIVVIGGTGRIGSAIVKELSPRHEVLIASRHDGDVTVDVTSEKSIRSLFEKVGACDAVAMASGTVLFEPFEEMTPEKYQVGLKDKLMGQVNIVLIGRDYLKDTGSFTLISGVLSEDPIQTGSSASMVNAAIDGFVKAAAIEMPRNIRINAVSATVVEEAMDVYAPYFRGFIAVPAAKVALAFSKSIEGLQTGQIYRVWN